MAWPYGQTILNLTKSTGVGVDESWALIPNMVPTSYLTLGKTLNLLGFQYLHL